MYYVLQGVATNTNAAVKGPSWQKLKLSLFSSPLCCFKPVWLSQKESTKDVKRHGGEEMMNLFSFFLPLREASFYEHFIVSLLGGW